MLTIAGLLAAAPDGPEADKAGPLGLLTIVALGVAVYFLYRSMVGHMKKIPPDDPPLSRGNRSRGAVPQADADRPADADPPAGPASGTADGTAAGPADGTAPGPTGRTADPPGQ